MTSIRVLNRTRVPDAPTGGHTALGCTTGDPGVASASEQPDASAASQNYGIRSPKLMPRSRAVSIVSQSSGTDFIRLVASASGT